MSGVSADSRPSVEPRSLARTICRPSGHNLSLWVQHICDLLRPSRKMNEVRTPSGSSPRGAFVEQSPRRTRRTVEPKPAIRQPPQSAEIRQPSANPHFAAPPANRAQQPATHLANRKQPAIQSPQTQSAGHTQIRSPSPQQPAIPNPQTERTRSRTSPIERKPAIRCLSAKSAIPTLATSPPSRIQTVAVWRARR